MICLFHARSDHLPSAVASPCRARRGIVFAKAFFEDIRRLDAWGYTFVTSAIMWALAAVLAFYILVTISLWYRRNGGERPTTKVRPGVGMGSL